MTLTVTLTVTLIQESLSDLRTAVEREPHAAHHRVELARSYREVGEHSRACIQLKEAVALHPKDAEMHVELSRALWTLGEPSEPSPSPSPLPCGRSVSPRSPDLTSHLSLGPDST